MSRILGQFGTDTAPYVLRGAPCSGADADVRVLRGRGWTLAGGRADGREGVSAVLAGAVEVRLPLLSRIESRGRPVAERNHAALLRAAFEADGAGFAEQLRGAYAAAVVDTRGTPVLVLATDDTGAVPLYYHWNASREVLSFATDIPGLLALLPDRPALWEPGLDAYLTTGAALGGATLFEGVRLLPPGTTAVCERGRAPRLIRRGPAGTPKVPAPGLRERERAVEALGRGPGWGSGGEPSRETAGEPGREAGALGRDRGGNPGRGHGGEAGRETDGNPGREAGGEPGREASGNPGREAGGEPGREAGGEPGREAGGNPGREAGGNPGREAGGEPGREAGALDRRRARDLPVLLPALLWRLGQPDADPGALTAYAPEAPCGRYGRVRAEAPGPEAADLVMEAAAGRRRVEAALADSGEDWLGRYAEGLAPVGAVDRSRLYSTDYRAYLAERGDAADGLVARLGEAAALRPRRAVLTAFERDELLPVRGLRRAAHLGGAGARVPGDARRHVSQLLVPGGELTDLVRELLSPARLRASGLLSWRAVERLLAAQLARPSERLAGTVWALSMFELWREEYAVAVRRPVQRAVQAQSPAQLPVLGRRTVSL